MKPIYLRTDLKTIGAKKKKLFAMLESCSICPRKCGVNRLKDEKSFCGIGIDTIVASYQKHFGEEAPLVGRNGSGTIFMSGCNLLCSFCQNYDISHHIAGVRTSHKLLSDMMIKLQNSGCHNINFVTPTHVVHNIVAAVEIAIEKGLNIPLVYNSSGYDSIETIKILDGIIDIYMPDFKFMNSKTAEDTCDASDYPEIALNAIKEMQRQVGDLVVSDEGIAEKGLIIRHLVMPNDVCDTKAVMEKIADEISLKTFINVMAQYRPLHKASGNNLISKAINSEEFSEALAIAKKVGLKV
ncbi:MAG: radical SAM protein [Desulfobacterales bacterium]|nr:radical SAM protein [Desulfobacterales bacterium]